MTRRFHSSEAPGIVRFEPRVVVSWDAPVDGLAIWGVDHEHLLNYLLPRDCPPARYVCDTATAPVDRERFFGISSVKRIIAIEPL